MEVTRARSEIEMLTALDDRALEQRLRQLEAAQRRLEGQRALALAEFERRGHGRGDGFRSIAAWCRGVLGWSRRECRARGQMTRVVDAFPEIADELLDATLPVANAEALARAWANRRVRDRFPEFLGEFLNKGSRLEYDDFEGLVDHFVTLADVDGAHRERGTAHEHRTAHFTEFAGTGTLLAQWGDLDTEINRSVYERFVRAEWEHDWAWTVQQYGDEATPARMPRTDAQRRADAVSTIMRRAGATQPVADQDPADGAAAPGGRSKGPAGIKLTTNVHIDWQNWRDLMAWAGLFPERVRDPFEAADTLVGQWRCCSDDGTVLDPVAVLQASLEGYVRFIVLGDDGVPIRWGRERRLFEGAAREAVMVLADRCTQPGCRVPSSRSEADHLQPWSEGGRTDPDNGGPKCATHNRFRNRGYRSARDRFGWHTYRPHGTEIC